MVNNYFQKIYIDMTREEEIQEAKDKTFPTPKEGRSYESAWAAGGFEMGAHWADEHPINVWHDAIEEPQGEYEILWQDIFGYTDRTDHTEVDNRYAGEWGECVDHEGIVRWAYIKDLLPKGGEQ